MCLRTHYVSQRSQAWSRASLNTQRRQCHLHLDHCSRWRGVRAHHKHATRTDIARETCSLENFTVRSLPGKLHWCFQLVTFRFAQIQGSRHGVNLSRTQNSESAQRSQDQQSASPRAPHLRYGCAPSVLSQRCTAAICMPTSGDTQYPPKVDSGGQRATVSYSGHLRRGDEDNDLLENEQ